MVSQQLLLSELSRLSGWSLSSETPKALKGIEYLNQRDGQTQRSLPLWTLYWPRWIQYEQSITVSQVSHSRIASLRVLCRRRSGRWRVCFARRKEPYKSLNCVVQFVYVYRTQRSALSRPAPSFPAAIYFDFLYVLSSSDLVKTDLHVNLLPTLSVNLLPSTPKSIRTRSLLGNFGDLLLQLHLSLH